MEHGFYNKDCTELSQGHGNADNGGTWLGGYMSHIRGPQIWNQKKESEENILKKTTTGLKRKLRKPQ